MELSLKRGSPPEELVNHGIRITVQRRILVEIFQEAESHLDAATLLEPRNRDVRIDLTTVYRTLDPLKKSRLIDELDLMHVNEEKHYCEAKTYMHLAWIRCV